MSQNEDLEQDADVLAFHAAQKRARDAGLRNTARLLAAFVVAAAVGFGVFSFFAIEARESAEARAARAARGEIVVEVRRRHDPTGGVLGLGLLSVAAGALAFVGSYRLVGGRLDPDTVRTLKELLTGRAG